MKKRDLLQTTVEHIDVKSFDARPIIAAMGKMSFSSRDTARAADILGRMIEDRDCTIILTIAGSTSAAGCMQIYVDMVEHRMVDAIVATGASIVDMDFFEALGYKHYRGTPFVDDALLRKHYVDRIYDTYIDEEELQHCDRAVKQIADALTPGIYSSRAFIAEMGRYLATGGAKKQHSLVQAAFEHDVPIFCPAFSDSSAGFGLVLHQEGRERYVSIDSVRDFRELTEIKLRAKRSGLFMIGGGVPKNFAQDTVVCAEVLGREVPVHQYAVQITVADVRDGACSSSTLKEASSWGKVGTANEQMVYAEATTVLPLIVSAAYHDGAWRRREQRRLARIFAAGAGSAAGAAAGGRAAGRGAQSGGAAAANAPADAAGATAGRTAAGARGAAAANAPAVTASSGAGANGGATSKRRARAAAPKRSAPTRG